MKYPRKDPYLIFKKNGTDRVLVKHYLLDEEYSMNELTARFLKKLNGKRNPYQVLRGVKKPEVDRTIRNLRECGLLKSKQRITTLGIGSCMIPLVYCDCLPAFLRSIAKIWNQCLVLLCIPLLIMGLIVANSGRIHIVNAGKAEMIIGLALALLSGAIFHELSHFCAALTYKAHVFEMGIGTHFFIPMGYAAIDYENVKGRMKRIQIVAAGIEMNLILYGVFMALCLLPSGIFTTYELYLAAVGNLGMAIVNILPLDGLDGLSILSEAFGKTNLYEIAKKTVRNKWLRVAVLRKGLKGKLSVTGSYLLVAFQVMLPVLIVIEVISLFRIFVL